MATVSIDQATMLYGSTRALDEMCLEIKSGEFITLLGPSGCGKSTTLRAVAGLIGIDRGTIAIGGKDVTRVPINRRNIGMVFQNLALFPHMTVAENIGFGLRMRHVAKAERDRRIAETLALVRLPDLGARLPSQLSGGQQQRVAIARALVIDPSVLLLDEPFAALDRKLREEMQIELRELTRRVGITSIFVTHDQEEALTLSDRITVMNAGRVEQVGAPDAIYSTPETRFVADFMGARNIFECEVVGVAAGTIMLAWHDLRLECRAPEDRRIATGRRAAVALRPELIKLSANGAMAAPNAASGTVLSSVDQGAFVTLRVDLGRGRDSAVTVRRAKAEQAEAGALAPGAQVIVSWRARDVILLRDDPRGETRRAGSALELCSRTETPETVAS